MFSLARVVQVERDECWKPSFETDETWVKPHQSCGVIAVFNTQELLFQLLTKVKEKLLLISLPVSQGKSSKFAYNYFMLETSSLKKTFEIQCSITYWISWHGCMIFLPLRETIEESVKRRHLWQSWAKQGAARCPECNAASSIGFRGCKQSGLQGRVWGRYRTLFTNSSNTNNYKTLW